jgi:hypothetical protein
MLTIGMLTLKSAVAEASGGRMLMRKTAFASVFLVLLFSICIAPPAPAQVAVGITVGFAPPALPVYEQPVCPAPDYIWTPGYWAWDADFNDYYWVPGTWVLAPEVGLLWTPPWWGWNGTAFAFNDGFWGPTVGFYGGVAYGFGYFGVGFEGGYWQSGHFFYNQSVVNVNVTEIHNVYTKTVVNSTTVNHVSYNGGEGGINARPTAQDEEVDRQQHVAPTAEQTQQIQAARSNPELRASNNQGKPRIAATSRPGDFSGSHVSEAKSAGAPYHPPAGHPAGAGAEPAHANTAVHPSDLPNNRAPAPNTGNAKLDKKYQKQQDKLYTQQEKESQQLQKQQDQEHLQADNDKADAAARQQMEQKHQQQTQEMQQRHAQEQQQLQARQTHRGPG